MGLATLNVWIHDKQDPCKISDEVWWVAVTYCNGNPVEWCGHTYSFEEAKCGHVELRLPPGCYIVHGLQFFFLKKLFLFHFTEHAIVIVNCDELGCAHLFTPTSRQWPKGAVRAVRFLAESQHLPKDKVEAFVAASDALLKDMPETAVDAAHERLVQHLTDFLQRNPPK
jgi:hypothetical protein